MSRDDRAALWAKPEFATDLELRMIGGAHGTGLRVSCAVAHGERILSFGGPRWSRADYDTFEDIEHCLQVGVHQFLGPSGDLDDFTNHSCEPSTRVVIDRDSGRAHLVALRDLDPGDEVTFDYSSVQLHDLRFRIDDCRCGARSCRGAVTDFTLLPWEQKVGLYERGLCVWYVVEAFLEECERRSFTPPAPPQR